MPESQPNSTSGPAPAGPERGGKEGSYVVVARRYRPRGFDELVGQQHVGQALKNAIETSRVGHAYLFTGARGVGKTSTARIFAKALNDPSGPTTSPDNTSDVALAIDSGEDVDVIEIDGASNRGIDEIRSLRANIGVRPSRSRFKIYIIDEVHMLTQAAFNALLKTLEEPPEHVKFIFCTTDPEKIPITVLSRCQRFDFAPVELQKIVERLRFIVDAESAEADDAALELIARRAAGSMRDSQSLLEQVLSFSNGKLNAGQVHAMLGTADDERLHALAKALADRDAASALTQMDEGIDAGVDAGRLAEQLLGYFRDLMAVSVGCDASMLRHTSVSLHEQLRELGERWGLQTVLAVVGLIDQTLVRIRHSVYSRVLLEATLIQICHLPDLQQIADLAGAVQATPSTTRSGSSASQATSSPVSPRQAQTSPEKKNEPVASLGSPSPSWSAASNHSDTRGQREGSVPATAIHQADPSGPAGHHLASSPRSTSDTAAVSRERNPDPSSSSRSLSGSASSPSGAPVAVLESGRTLSPAALPAETSSAGLPWSQSTAEGVWRQVLENLESMTETFARVVQGVKAEGDRTLRLTFPHDGGLAKRRCELPEHKHALAEAVARAAGQVIQLEFEIAAPPAIEVAAEPAPNKPSRIQRMREIESNPLVRSCVDLFDAEIVRIEKPREIQR
jgi:DNA polymerase-3 subunit gamma/tau